MLKENDDGYAISVVGNKLKIEWEKDDVDRTIDEFRYIVSSLSLDTI